MSTVEKDIQELEAWFQKEWNTVQDKVIPVVIKAMQDIRLAETSGILPVIATALAPITKGLSVEINDFINQESINILADALAIQQVPILKTATEEEILAFESAIALALGGKSFQKASAIYVKVTADWYIMIKDALNENNGTLGYAQIVSLIFDMYQKYVDDITTVAASKAIEGNATINEGKAGAEASI
jgi:hypothetical protein